jgi:hypothetical protein
MKMYGDYRRDVIDGVGFLKIKTHDDNRGDILINLDYIRSITKYWYDKKDFPKWSGCCGFMVGSDHLKRDDYVNFDESWGYSEYDTADSFIEKNLVVLNEDRKVYSINCKTDYRHMVT